MFDSKVHVLDHPLLQHKLSILRDERTGVKEFREIVSEIATLECYEATRDLPLEDVEIKTPVATGTFKCLTGKKLAIVPILRAGLGMVDGILTLIPSAKVGHIGLYRDPETLAPVEYYCKMPHDIAERDVIVLDPMLATGGSAVAAIQFLKNYIELMRIRYTDAVNISVESPGNLPEQLSIPPLLLIVFVENAFKHGVSYSKPSFIHMRIDYADGKVVSTISNSLHTPQAEKHNAGIGLENVRKRLSLIYGPKNYSLDIGETNETYTVKLVIPTLHA